MSFHGVEESSDPEKTHLIRLWAAEHSAAEKAELAETTEQEKPESAETAKSATKH